MSLPKKALIEGLWWKIKQNKTHSSGNFDFATLVIEIGTLVPENSYSIFMHEVLEIIMVEKDCRYAPDNDKSEVLFVFHHKEFSDIIRSFVNVMRQIKHEVKKPIKKGRK